jgi:hypothetical protein
LTLGHRGVSNRLTARTADEFGATLTDPSLEVGRQDARYTTSTETTPADADQALKATKDPYVFDFLELSEDARERDLEGPILGSVSPGAK